jgi:hypothetical protein
MSTIQEQANDIVSGYEAGALTEEQALAQLKALGVHPLHAAEMLTVARGESDVEGEGA